MKEFLTPPPFVIIKTGLPFSMPRYFWHELAESFSCAIVGSEPGQKRIENSQRVEAEITARQILQDGGRVLIDQFRNNRITRNNIRKFITKPIGAETIVIATDADDSFINAQLMRRIRKGINDTVEGDEIDRMREVIDNMREKLEYPMSSEAALLLRGSDNISRLLESAREYIFDRTGAMPVHGSSMSNAS